MNPSEEAYCSRRTNFSQAERMILLALIEKNKSALIENKIDGSWRKKSDIWAEIAKEYNASSIEDCSHRDARQLRKCWENMKTRYRKANPTCVRATDALFEGNKLQFGFDVKDDFVLKQKMSTLVSPEDSSEILESGCSSFVAMDNFPSYSVPVGLEVPVTKEEPRTPTIQILDDDELRSQENKSVSEPKGENNSACDEISMLKATSVFASGGEDVSSGISRAPTSKENTSFLLENELQKHANDQSLRKDVCRTPPSAVSSSVQMSRNSRKRRFLLSDDVRRGRQRINNITYLSRSGNHKVGAVFTEQQTHRSNGNRLVNNNLMRPSTVVDTEKLLRTRLLRTQIRVQETRIRLMQQKIRQERERHEVALLLFRRRAAHYEALTDNLRSNIADNFNGDIEEDDDLCEDMTWGDI